MRIWQARPFCTDCKKGMAGESDENRCRRCLMTRADERSRTVAEIADWAAEGGILRGLPTLVGGEHVARNIRDKFGEPGA